MSLSHRYPALVAGISILTALLASSCATKQPAFKLSFLPSTPALVEPTFEAPPEFKTNF